jgi:hypothetical protein
VVHAHGHGGAIAGTHDWVPLLRRMLAIDVLVCERRAGLRRILSAVTEPHAVRQLFAALGLAPALSAVLTSETWEDRLLGRMEPVAVSDEIARRTVHIRLDAKVDRLSSGGWRGCDADPMPSLGWKRSAL